MQGATLYHLRRGNIEKVCIIMKIIFNGVAVAVAFVDVVAAVPFDAVAFAVAVSLIHLVKPI